MSLEYISFPRTPIVYLHSPLDIYTVCITDTSPISLEISIEVQRHTLLLQQSISLSVFLFHSLVISSVFTFFFFLSLTACPQSSINFQEFKFLNIISVCLLFSGFTAFTLGCVLIFQFQAYFSILLTCPESYNCASNEPSIGKFFVSTTPFTMLPDFQINKLNIKLGTYEIILVMIL